MYSCSYFVKLLYVLVMSLVMFIFKDKKNAFPTLKLSLTVFLLPHITTQNL